MKLWTLFRLFSLLIFMFNIFQTKSAAQNMNSVQSIHSGIINVYSGDDSINIFLDGQFIGTPPIQSYHVSEGLHVLQALPANPRVWGKNVWNQDFEIKAGDSININITLPQHYYINSTPFGANIIYQDSTLGTTPHFFTLPDSSRGIIVLRKAGYLDYIIKLSNKKTNFFDVRLNLDKQSEEEKIKFSTSLQIKQKRRKILTYSVLGLSVVSGLTTIYFRREADQSYQRYLSSGHPLEMDRFYNETQDFDDYAAISYGIFQVSFVTSLYLLFFNK